jgi:hypothetical protein
MKVDELTIGARVRIKSDEVGTVIWIQPDDWMDGWSRQDAMGGWMDRLSAICQADLNALDALDGEGGRWLRPQMACDRDKPRVIVRLDKRTVRASGGFPPGSVRYAWVLPRSLRPVDGAADEATP